jgi:hypothetical protein
MDSSLFTKLLNLLTCLLERFYYLLVGFLLVHLLLLLAGVFFLGISELIFELLDDIKISVGDLLVVVLNIGIFLIMFLS